MATGRPYPKWLPPAVAEYAAHLSAGRPAQLGFELPLHACVGPLVSVAVPEGSARLHRLTHDPRMAQVWRDLQQEMGRVAQVQCAPERVEAAAPVWLRGYLLKALTADLTVNSLASMPNPVQQRDTLGAIATRVRALIDLLGEDFLSSWVTDRLDEALAQTTYPKDGTRFRNGKRLKEAQVPESIRVLFARLATETYSHHWSMGAETSPPLITKNTQVPLIAVLGGLVERLEALAALADVSANISAERIPHRTERFKAAVYVRQLGEYLTGLGIAPRPDAHRAKGFPLYQLIAVTTNVALDPSYKVDADFVYRQVSQQRARSDRSQQ